MLELDISSKVVKYSMEFTFFLKIETDDIESILRRHKTEPQKLRRAYKESCLNCLIHIPTWCFCSLSFLLSLTQKKRNKEKVAPELNLLKFGKQILKFENSPDKICRAQTVQIS